MSQIQVPKGWNIESVGKICNEIYRYPTYYGITYEKEGVPEVRGTLIRKNGELEKDLTQYRLISKKTSQSFPKTILKEGDIVITVRGTMGKIGLVPKFLNGANITANLMRMSPKRELCTPEFLKYFFMSEIFQSELLDRTSTTTIRTIQAPKLKSIRVPLPPLIVQKKIVKKLDYILEQLQEKKKEILTLQEKNQESFKFMKKNLLVTFIGKLIPTSKIPKDWELKPLSEICLVERGKFGHRPRNDPDYYGGKYPFIQTGDIAKSNGKITEYHQTLNEKGFKVSRIFPKGTVVITIAANIGDTGILEFDSCFPDSIIGITPKKGKAIPEYIEFVLRLYKYSLERDASQGAQKNINYGFLKPLKVPIPLKLEKQKEIVRKIQGAETNIEKTLDHLDEVIQAQLIVKNHLHSLQNSIFDKAFTGKLVN